MADKKLNISADLKFKATDAEKTLQKLQKEGIKLSKIFKDLDINTGTGKASFAKSLMNADKAMLKLKGTTGDTAKVMEHVYGKQLEKQSRNLDNYTKKIERLNSRFKTQQYNASLQGVMGNSDQAARYTAMANRTADKIVVAEAARQATAQAIKELKGDGGNGNLWGQVRGGVAATQMVAGSVSQFAGVYQQMKNQEDRNLASVMSFQDRLVGRMRGGDFSDLYFMSRRNKGLQRSMDVAGGRGAINTQLGSDLAQHVAGGIGAGMDVARNTVLGGATAGVSELLPGVGAGATADAVSRGIQHAGGAYVAGKNLTNGTAAAGETQNIMESIDLQKLQSPMARMALEQLSGQALMRVQAARALQGQHMAAGFMNTGLGFEGNLALAQGLSSQFGVNATMQGGLMKGAVDLQRHGMDLNVGATALGTITQSMGGTMGNGGTTSDAQRALYEIMSKSVSRGVTDAKLGQEIVRAAGEMAFGQGGANQNIAAVGMALSGGLDKNSTMREVQMNAGSMQTMDNMMNNNAYFSGMKLEMLKKAAGQEGIPLTPSMLLATQKASTAELIGGSTQLTASGVSDYMRREMMNNMANSFVKTFAQKNDPAYADLYGAMGRNGGDIVKALSGSKGEDRKTLVREFGMAFSLGNEGVSQEQGEALGRMLSSGYDSASGGHRKLKTFGDSAAEATVGKQLEVLDGLYKQEVKIREDYLKALRTVDPLLDEANKQENNPNMDSAQKMMGMLAELFAKMAKDPRFLASVTGQTKGK